jgi:RNA polymerase sigma-70 factor (ECF subfamily)
MRARAEPAQAPLAGVDAFREFYDQVLPRIYAYFYHRCGRAVGTAEELTQETFLAAVTELRKGKHVDDPLAWIRGIARHKLIDHYRRQARSARVSAIAAPISGDTAAWDAAEDRELTLLTLDALPALQRAALVLRYLDDLSVRDVAHALGKSVHATESLLARGKESFRRAYPESDR